jgi:hypothetical protein
LNSDETCPSERYDNLIPDTIVKAIYHV